MAPFRISVNTVHCLLRVNISFGRVFVILISCLPGSVSQLFPSRFASKLTSADQMLASSFCGFNRRVIPRKEHIVIQGFIIVDHVYITSSRILHPIGEGPGFTSRYMLIKLMYFYQSSSE